MYYNPAFAGIQQNFRASGLVSVQWPGDKIGNYITTNFTADIGLTKINSGVGIMFTNDQLNTGQNSNTSISVFYSYEIKLGTNSFLRLGINPSIFTITNDYRQVRFDDQIDPNLGFVYATQERLKPDVYATQLAPNVGFGTLFYNKNIYAGVAASDIIEHYYSYLVPNQSQPSTIQLNSNHLYRRFDAQAGGFINAGNVVINPNILFVSQGAINQGLLGVNFTMGIFTIGTSIRETNQNIDEINFLAGIAKGKFKLCYSYSLPLDGTVDPPPAIFDVSLVFQLNKPNDVSSKPLINHLRNAY